MSELNLAERIARRILHLQRVNADRHLQALELAMCGRDVVHFVNTWGWTYDPRRFPTVLPFDLFPKQVEMLRWLADREQAQEDGLVEKSREVGVTWLCCVYALHGWLFRDGFHAGFGSRKLDLVDQIGNPDSIFEKIRFFLYQLPGWMAPLGFRRGQHDNEARLVNPANGSTLTGEGGDNIGRGGRATIYFVDESAFLERPDSVERSLSQNTPCRIDVSTPNGPGNVFATKRFSGKVPVFTLHWRDDPRKDEAWYARQKAMKDAVTIAQELDIDYTASVEGITIPAAWVRAAVNLPLSAGKGLVVGGYDVAEEGRDVSVLIVRQGPVVRVPVSWGACNTTEGAWRAHSEALRLGVVTLHYDAGGPGMGVKGTWEAARQDPHFLLGFEAIAVNFGGTPTDSYWPDGQTSAEKFLNLRAEMWWRLRARFEKAYECREQGITHRPEEMISIPDHPQLIAELSQPLSFRTNTGKVKLEAKDDMRRRGVKSPDFGDALALAFLETGAGPWRMGPAPRDSQSELLHAPAGVFASDQVQERQVGPGEWEDDWKDDPLMGGKGWNG